MRRQASAMVVYGLMAGGCREPAGEAPSSETGGEEAGRFTLVATVTRLGEPVDVQVLVLAPDAIWAEDPTHVAAWGRAGDDIDIPSGDWLAYAGESYDPDGGQAGMPFHVADDDTMWIAAPVEVEGVGGDRLAVTLPLNLLVGGWWTCCDDIGICAMDEVMYEGGERAFLPGLGSIEVSGLDFTGAGDEGTITGAFVDSHRAVAESVASDGTAHDYVCCDSGAC